MLLKLFYNTFLLGASKRFPIYKRKEIILTNRIAVVFQFISIGGALLFLINRNMSGVWCSIIVCTMGVGALLFNYYKKANISRQFVTSITCILLLFNLYFCKGFVPYFLPGVSVLFLGISILPFFLFHFREEKHQFYISAAITFAIFLLFEPIFFMFKFSGAQGQSWPVLAYYQYIKAPQVVLWLVLVFAITYFRIVTWSFEKRLFDAYLMFKHRNREANMANREVVARNAELKSAREEVIGQKEYIEHQHLQLTESHNKLKQYVEELKATQESLERQEAKNRSLLQALKESFIVAEFNADGKLSWVNGRTKKVLKIKDGFVPDFQIKEIQSESTLCNSNGYVDVQELWKEILKGNPKQIQKTFNLKKSQITLTATMAPILNELKQVEKIIAIGQDISLLREQQCKIERQNEILRAQKEEIKAINDSLEERVKSRTKTLEEQKKKLEEYAFINSHLLRGPVSTILGIFNLLEMNVCTKDEALILLQRATERLDTIVAQINSALYSGELSRDYFKIKSKP